MPVQHTDERVWIDHIKGFSPAEYASSVHGAQARILQALGESLSYSDLICFSGFAFRMGVHTEMCPSAAHPCCGYPCIDNGLRAIPWDLRMYESFPWSDPRSDADRQAFEFEVAAAVKTSIDRGIPVHYSGEEDGLIIGYADNGRRWWCIHPYHKWGAEPFWYDDAKGFAGGHGKWPWAIVVWEHLKPAESMMSRHDLTTAALKQAVDMWYSSGLHDSAYYSGDAAYSHWLNWLRGIDSGAVDNPKAGMQGNGWCFDVLIHSRTIAAEWLRTIAAEHDERVREQLLQAADQYASLAARCMAGIDCPWTLCPGPDKFDAWTREMRTDQIERLESARNHDQQAVQAIAHALEQLGDRTG